MKKILTALVAMALCATVFADEVTPPLELVHCNAPIASVMVGKLTCKSANCDGSSGATSNPLAALIAMSSGGGQGQVTGLGEGVRDMFVTVLQNTGCVDIQERESLNEIAEELKLAGKTIKVQQADYLVSGALTTVELDKSSTGFGGGFIPIIGSISKNTQKATVGLDIRLVDVNSAKVIDTQRHMATSENSSFGIGGGGLGSMGGVGFGVGGSMSSLKGTSLEVVSREAVIKAANGVVVGLKRAKGV